VTNDLRSLQQGSAMDAIVEAIEKIKALICSKTAQPFRLRPSSTTWLEGAGKLLIPSLSLKI
jgi:hypothetical protein